jgi:hypothetical protein
MDVRQRNFFNMMKALVDMMMSNKTIWEGEPMIVAGMTKLNGICVRIEEEAASQHGNVTKGRTASKNMERDKLETWMYTICGRMLLYASTTGDLQTAELVKYSHSQLAALPLEKLLTEARSIISKAYEIGEPLIAYKVADENIDQLKILVDRTAELSAHRDAIKGKRTSNTINISDMFKEIRKELKQMDKNIEVYMTDKNFIQEYFVTRRIVDRKGGGTKKKETTTTETTEN